MYLHLHKLNLHVITYGLGMNFPTTRTSFLHTFSHKYSHYLGTVRLLLGGWGIQKGVVYQNLTPPQKKPYLHMKIVPLPPSNPS